MSDLLLAFVLGFRHGLDADHLTLIDNLGRWLRKKSPRAARLAGLLFSSGHSFAVLCMTLVAVQFGQQLRTPLPSWLDGAGTVLAASALIVLAALNINSALAGPGRQGHTHQQHTHQRSRWSDTLSNRLRVSPNGPFAALSVALLGALFAFSFDTMTQAALFAGLGQSHPQALVHAALLSGLFGLGMISSDTLNGLIVNKLLDRLSGNQAGSTAAIEAKAQAMRLMTLSLACLSLLVAGLALFKLWAPNATKALEGHEMALGMMVMGWVLLSYCAAAWISVPAPLPPTDRA